MCLDYSTNCATMAHARASITKKKKQKKQTIKPRLAFGHRYAI